MLDWLIENKEWVFSGVGLAVAGWFISRRSRNPEKHGRTEAGDKINISARGDVVFAKDNAKSSLIKDSQVGVVGDNTKVEGGINFGSKFSIQAEKVQGLVQADKIDKLTQNFGKSSEEE